jgi:hypothetical protein
MNFFKKALIATAVAGTFGAVQAADVTNAITKTSAQGVELGVVSGDPSVRVIVRELLEAGDTVTLTFGKDMFSTAPSAVTFSNSGGAVPASGEVSIDYGSGTFTFGEATATTTDGVTTVTFKVQTGDPMPKDASFEVFVYGAELDATKTADAKVAYSAVSGLTGDAKDTTGTNMGSFISLTDQFSSSVASKFDGVIERESQVTFVSGGSETCTPVAPATTCATTDNFILTIGDDVNLGSAAVSTDVVATVTVKGDFSNNTGVMTLVAGTTTTGTAGFADYAIAADKLSASFTLTGTGAAGLAGNYDINLDPTLGGSAKIQKSTYTVSVSVDADKNVTTNTAQVTSTDVDAGKWLVDATMINIPYLVVGKEGTDAVVHFSNTGPEADVIVSAVSVVDANGDSVTYADADLGVDLAANSVTKIKQSQIIDALGIPAGTQKLSVTFNVSGQTDDITAYAFIKDESGRTEVSNSQQLNK